MKLRDIPNDELFQLERKIARRADQLLEQRSSELTALDSWLQAEREIWETMAAGPLQACSSTHPRSF
jgi:hypothetical protein